MKASAYLLGCCAALIALSGCAAQPVPRDAQPAADSTWEMPLWAVNTNELETKRMEALLKCIQDYGWDAKLVENGIDMELTADQDPIYQRDMAQCDKAVDEKYPLEQTSPAELSDEQWQQFYGQFEDSVACLRHHGYEISDLPSLPTFRDQYLNGEFRGPFSELFEQAGREFSTITEVCPQPIGISLGK